MHIQFNYGNLDSSDALETHIRSEIDSTIGRFADRISRIEVHISDINGHRKSGPADKRCMLEARPNGMDPIVVESTTDDYNSAVSDAAGKLRRALTTRLEKAEVR
ncbi:MAG: HPF/RaiA family ribosome-associated protein [Phycisphaerales bacterium]|nr:HPF/RaiA family ribosome-associated protein [Planctomycetota bacterium]MCH8509753.1 HPF/RaiA family ribosome-associated protein [Phycisphaerales bacterium]